MSDIWLIVHNVLDGPQMTREVQLRAPDCRLLRSCAPLDVALLVQLLPDRAAGVLFSSRGLRDETLLSMVSRLHESGRVEQILVVIDRLDPALIARVFQAGAGEVIAAEDVVYHAEPLSGEVGAKGVSAQAALHETTSGGVQEELGSQGLLTYDKHAGEMNRDTRAGKASATRCFNHVDKTLSSEVASIQADESHVSPTARAASVSIVDMPSSAAVTSTNNETAAELNSKLSAPVMHEGMQTTSYVENLAKHFDLDEADGVHLAHKQSEQPKAVAHKSKATDVHAAPVMHEGMQTTSYVENLAKHFDLDEADGVHLAHKQSEQPKAVAHKSKATDVHAAPVISVISGRGGVGKSTLVCAMAWAAARQGLRTAVLDIDLMFGNMYRLFGLDEAKDLSKLCRSQSLHLEDEDIEITAMQVAPGLTLWGPLTQPELAERMGEPIEHLIELLRGLADIILVDTSTFWGDAVAAAVAASNRVLVVGTAAASGASSGARVITLAARLGVPRTRMISVVTKMGAPTCTEEFALRFEMATSLKSKARVADAGQEAVELIARGKLESVIAEKSNFSLDVQRLLSQMLKELGLEVQIPEALRTYMERPRPKMRLPWKK
ncbi:P-loop NTPase [Collinsella sp. zg1085]|uniref:AAA family ATPase n=1 Tax=Collinsella sp. zg1085 TaxID=2844380 RepID=UPI001C0BDA19|nr:P-loop NTPase [Collinsella sp. zg1085]QWT17467.1 P-loop NTPase [Collinsella sp. zg1085]